VEQVKLEDLVAACERQAKQVAFLADVWDRKDENYPTLARAVLRDLKKNLEKVKTLQPGRQRRELTQAFEDLRSAIYSLNDRHYILDTWSGSTSRHSQSVRSVRSGGLPGLGR
jgi:hypothetical protein